MDSERRYDVSQATQILFNSDTESDFSIDDPLDEEQLSDDQDLTYIPSGEETNLNPGPSEIIPKPKPVNNATYRNNDQSQIIEDLETFLKKQPIDYIINQDELKKIKADYNIVSISKAKSFIEIAKRCWTTKEKNPSPDNVFRRPHGPRADFFTDFTSPGDVFTTYLDQDLIQHLCYQSNLYIYCHDQKSVW
ncbi:hypothetical protein SNE40_010830 [Patella caerulea]|uniref:Uncharacterized protein n=1 Tax=Patella caerulea TaxID=87958 RepID=A0AAN8PT79_PATCE